MPLLLAAGCSLNTLPADMGAAGHIAANALLLCHCYCSGFRREVVEMGSFGFLMRTLGRLAGVGELGVRVRVKIDHLI
jgi:hypothetical protein